MLKLDIPGLENRSREIYENSGPGYRKLTLTYALVTLVVNLVVLLLSEYLLRAADNLGGLTNAGSRASLSSAALILPVLASLFLIIAGAGFSASVLNLARGREVTPKGLLQALPQTHKILWTGVKMVLWTMPVIYLLAIGISVILTPILMAQSGEVTEAFLQASSNAEQTAILTTLISEKGMNAMMAGILIPCYGFMLVLYFRRRLAFFYLLDHPDVPAGFLAKGSISLLKGFGGQFLRLDLRFWWYYVLFVVASVLPLLDTGWFSFIPVSGEAITMLLNVLSVVLTTALFYYGKSRLWITYALAYDQVLAWKKAQREKARQETLAETPSFS